MVQEDARSAGDAMSRMEELAERAVNALEQLAKDPVIHVETMPPVCPHCEEMNPIVGVKETEGQGALGEIVIKATCLRCSNEFVAMPVQMECVKTVEEAVELMEERKRQRGFNGGKNQRAQA